MYRGCIVSVKPSSKFLILVNKVHGSVNAAASVWQVHPAVLYRFIEGAGGLSLETAAQISHKTGVTLDELFVCEPEKEAKK